MNIEFFVSQHHPAAIVWMCASAATAVLIAAFARDARIQHNQQKESERKCPFCYKGKLVRRYLQVELPRREDEPPIKGIFRIRDYLSQIQATCQNPGCSYKCEQDWNEVKKGKNMPFVVRTQEKNWRLKSRVTRFRQLRRTVSLEFLIHDTEVLRVIRERKLRPMPPKSVLPFGKPQLGGFVPPKHS